MPTNTEAKIKRYFSNWEWLVTHFGWKFDVHYSNGYSDMPSSATAGTAMITFPQYDYLKGNIYVNLDVCEDQEEMLEEFVVHEIVHMLLSPMGDGAPEKLVEYTTTSIARLFLSLKKRRK